MRKTATAIACLLLAACSHVSVPLLSKPPVVGLVEFDTGLTKFSSETGIYHQDMCSSRESDAHVHLTNSEMEKILAQADKGGFYKVRNDLTTAWPDPPGRPPHCARFRLRIESAGQHNEVLWDCGADHTGTPPAEVATLVDLIRKTLRSKPEVANLPWSSCSVH